MGDGRGKGVSRETANGREWANESPRPVGRKTRRAEDVANR